MVDIIEKKKKGNALSKNEIQFFIEKYTLGTIPDYQASALLMAICLQGMNHAETTQLTLAMAHSGETFQLPSFSTPIVDKHSTGGIGDKTTLIVAPIVAAAGLPIAKMSGRGLGITGGTIDKLESIPGFQTNLTKPQFFHLLQKNQLVLSGQTVELAPADKKLYALRDVTGTVDSLPLIAASIMSKKLASGADRILLDVKVGSGAFMKDIPSAEKLAQLMIEIGRQAGKQTKAILTQMNEPLGFAVGNALEIQEAVHVLENKGPSDTTEICLTLASHMLWLGEKAPSFADAYRVAAEMLVSGRALSKFRQFVLDQGGHLPLQLSFHPNQTTITASTSGWIHQMDAEKVGKAAMLLGAGRTTKEDAIDYGAGIRLHKKVGDFIEEHEPIATFFGDSDEAQQIFHSATLISSTPCTHLEKILNVLE